LKALIFGALLLLSLLVLLAGWPELLGLAAWKAVATSAKADAELERLIGKTAADAMREDARRLSLISGVAVGCGLHDAGWHKELSVAALMDTAERAGKLTSDPRAAALRVQANFLLNMPAGLKTGAERKQSGSCGTVRYEGERREADRLVEKWR